MKLYVNCTIVPPPGVTEVKGEQLCKRTEHDQLGATLREILATPQIGQLLAMKATVVLVISTLELGSTAVLEKIERMQ